MNIPAQLNTIAKGGTLLLNGAPADTADIMAALSDLDAADLAMMQGELQDVINQMKWRMLPFQYIPTGEGPSPTLNIRIPGGGRQAWSVGSKWTD